MQLLHSQIESVTVFTGRAQITRVANVELEAGKHVLVFEKLPANLIQNSIQVNGLGNAIISHVKFKKKHHETIPEAQKQHLHDEKQKIQDEQRPIDDRLSRLRKEKRFIEDLVQKLSTPQDNEPTLILDPEKWAKMFDFYRQKLAELDAQIFETEKSARTIKAKLQKVQAELNQLGQSTQPKTTSNIEVLVQNEEKGTIQLSLSYLMLHANWFPIYDVRVFTEEKHLHLSYHATIDQQTGEDWEDCQIKLSTAKPQINGQQPELEPWRIRVMMPIATTVQERNKMLMREPVMAKLSPQIALMNDSIDAPHPRKKKMKVATTNIETKSTSVTFGIDGKHTIKSGSNDQKVTILMQKFLGHFQYSAVPKLSPYAYLKVKTINDTDFPFLKGKTNIFMDNNFVANSEIPVVAPSEDFWTFLGIDEGFKVKHKFLKKYEKKERKVFSKHQKIIIYEYSIEITNHKKTTEEIVISDQLPISENSNLKVHLIEPKYKEDTDTLKKNELNYLEWSLTLKAGEKIRIPFQFSVEFPQDKIVEGLD